MTIKWELHHDKAYGSIDSDLLANDKVKLIFTDPPFGTGKVQKMRSAEYMDELEHDAVLAGIGTCIKKYLHEDGTLAVLCDYRLAYDLVPFVERQGMVLRGEIIWEFGLGRPRTSWWPNRHNHVLTFTWTEDSGLFDASALPRERRLAPKKGYPDDRPAGSVWQYTMSNTDPERVEYPNQKSVRLIEPFILAHTNPGDIVLDPFCGSSSTGAAALTLLRNYVGIDNNEEAIRVSSKRIASISKDLP